MPAARYTGLLLDHSRREQPAALEYLWRQVSSSSKVGEIEGRIAAAGHRCRRRRSAQHQRSLLSGVVELVEASTQPDRSKALALIEAGIEQFDGGWLTPEWLRLKGELLLLQSSLEVTETAENLFGKALDEARGEEALFGNCAPPRASP